MHKPVYRCERERMKIFFIVPLLFIFLGCSHTIAQPKSIIPFSKIESFKVVKIALHALKNHEIKTLQRLIHPIGGLTLSANTYFDKTSDFHFSKESIIETYDKKQTLYWGEDETKGDSTYMTLAAYLQGLPSDMQQISKVKQLKDFKNFPQKNHLQGFELYWIGKENPEYNWKGLVIILQSYHDRWYVVGMLQDYWTP